MRDARDTLDALEELERGFRRDLLAAGADPRRIDEVRVRYLGRKGELTAMTRGLSALAPDLRPAAGQALNAVRSRIEGVLSAAMASARDSAGAAALARERVDVTLPARRPFAGGLHPVTLTRRELERIFRDLGFTVEEGPEVEDDFHNFQALNMPRDHPARDATDTFYLEGDLVLRTHTSPVQIRTLETQPPPIRMVCPGRVYRRDMDATHLPMFHQLECLVVDEDVSMADLKGDKRSRNIVYPRHIAMYLCHELTDSSLPRIGERFGGRDHTTVIHAINKISNLIKEEREVYNLVQQITSRLKRSQR